MSKELAIIRQTSVAEINPEQINILKKTLFKGFTDDELQFALAVCNRTGLDPFNKQVHFRKQKSGNDKVIVMITGIDGLRLTASRSQAYAGSDEPTFKQTDTKFTDTATVTVYRMVQGVRCPFTATARWVEYYPGDGNDGFMWRKMPFTMLGKCAESLALRKAFPAELSNIHSHEEMAQASNDKTLVQTKASQVNAMLESGPDLEIEHVEHTEPEPPSQELAADYIIKVGKNKGKQIKDLTEKQLSDFVTFYDEKVKANERMHHDVVEYYDMIMQHMTEGMDV